MIQLRPLDEGDVPGLAAMLADGALVGRRGLPDDRPAPRSTAAIGTILKELVDPGHGVAFAVEADTTVGLATASWWWDVMTPHAHVVIGREHQRRGHGRAAATALVDHLFSSSPALVVQSELPSWDADALTFAEAVGAERIGVHRRTGIRDGRYHDDIAFALTRDRWEEHRGARR